uniref:EF-hand domain-containing protein n=1 Tax=Parastrongyloides trichosuri TaxID=131310 RepID=A0A0N5A556_PARTI
MEEVMDTNCSIENLQSFSQESLIEDKPIRDDAYDDETYDQFYELVVKYLKPEKDTKEFSLIRWEEFRSITRRVTTVEPILGWMAVYIHAYVLMYEDKGEKYHTRYEIMDISKDGDISPREFYTMLCKWLKLIDAPHRVLTKVDHTNARIAISTVCFKKFLAIFYKIFRQVDPKYRPHRLWGQDTALSILWKYYIAFKQILNCGDDLMNAYHTLMCYFDFLCRRLREEGKIEMISQPYADLLNKNTTILDDLCKEFGGVAVDLKHFNEHIFYVKAEKLVSLLKNKPSDTDYLDYIEETINNVMEEYQESILDERTLNETVFLDLEPSRDKIDITVGRASVMLSQNGHLLSPKTPSFTSNQSLERLLSSIQEDKAKTPLLTKTLYFDSESGCPTTPLSAANYKRTQLAMLIDQYPPRPSKYLEGLLDQMPNNPKNFVVNLFTKLADKFCFIIKQESKVNIIAFDDQITDYAEDRKTSILALCFRVLESLLNREKQYIQSSESEYWKIISQENFIRSVFNVALELVLCAHNSQRDFPWSLRVTELKAINFSRIIELVIKANDHLAREFVKHLNIIEEKILEELAWTENSPIWKFVGDGPTKFPSSSYVQYQAADQSLSEIDRRQMKDYETLVKNREKETTIIEPPEVTQNSKIFIRKFYYLAAIRVVHLCERLSFNEENKLKIWNCIEYLFRNHITMLKSRHMDQIILCCCYVVAKVGRLEMTFNDILSAYRLQPQACQAIIKHVILEIGGPTSSPEEFKKDPKDFEGRRYNPNDKINAKRGHLINFYNKVFIESMAEIANKMRKADENMKSKIVPFPPLRQNPLSPKKQLTENITIVPQRSRENIQQSQRQDRTTNIYKYTFYKSPSKDLNVINKLVRDAGSNFNARPS